MKNGVAGQNDALAAISLRHRNILHGDMMSLAKFISSEILAWMNLKHRPTMQNKIFMRLDDTQNDVDYEIVNRQWHI